MITNVTICPRKALLGIAQEISRTGTAKTYRQYQSRKGDADMKRYKTNTAKDHRLFKQTANRTKRINTKGSMMRGGIRL